MANNVYIGNRYVPVFADPVEWDSLRAYENLTIVTYQGTSYTSRKNVPAGTALSNSEYWVPTGNYNAQVELYRQEVEELDGDVTTLSGNVSTLSGTVQTLSTSVSGLNDRVSVLEDDIVICIGDSYLQGYTTGGTIKSWGGYLQDYLGLDNDHFKMYYNGGDAFGNGGYGTLLNNAIAALSAAQKLKVKHVIVGGNWNDVSYDLTTIQNAMSTFKTTCKSAFPNAELFVIPFGWCCQELLPNPSTTAYNDHSICIVRWFSACGSLGIRTASSVYSAMFDNRCFSADYLHPNAVGQQLLGSAIFAEVFGRGYSFRLSFNNQGFQNLTGYAGTLTNGTIMKHCVNRELTEINWQYGTITYTPTTPYSVSAVNGTSLKIATFKDAGFGISGDGVTIPVNCYVHDANGYRTLADCCLMIKNSEIYLTLGSQTNDAHNNYLAISNATAFYIKPTMICLPIPNLRY